MYDPKTLEGLSAAELHQRRQELVNTIRALPGSYNEAPTEVLQELAYIAGALRRKTAGPPKVARQSKRVVTKGTADDLLGMLE